MTKKAQTLEQFKEEVGNLLMKDYGIGIGDCTDDDELEVEFKTGSIAQEFVDFIGEKHDLTKMKDLL